MIKSQNIKAEVEILLQRDMNSINNGWDSTIRVETLYFHCYPLSQNKMREKGKQEKKTWQWISQRKAR